MTEPLHVPVILIEQLTPREHEVLDLLVTGMSNVQIGLALYIADGTVRTHVSNIIGKMGVSNRMEAAMLARDMGMIPIPGSLSPIASAVAALIVLQPEVVDELSAVGLWGGGG